MTAEAVRPLRADAQRNRERLLEVAVGAFSHEGDSPVSLEAIAKQAGVGIGTLYRHFPTREALIEEAYRSELARLCDAAPLLLTKHKNAPDVALRAWMDRFVDYMSTKRGMAGALKAVIASGGTPFAESRDRMVTAATTLMDAGCATGRIRCDVQPDDLLVGLSVIAGSASDPEKRAQAGRLLDLLLDGLRTR